MNDYFDLYIQYITYSRSQLACLVSLTIITNFITTVINPSHKWLPIIAVQDKVYMASASVLMVQDFPNLIQPIAKFRPTQLQANV